MGLCFQIIRHYALCLRSLLHRQHPMLPYWNELFRPPLPFCGSALQIPNIFLLCNKSTYYNFETNSTYSTLSGSASFFSRASVAVLVLSTDGASVGDVGLGVAVLATLVTTLLLLLLFGLGLLAGLVGAAFGSDAAVDSDNWSRWKTEVITRNNKQISYRSLLYKYQLLTLQNSYSISHYVVMWLHCDWTVTTKSPLPTTSRTMTTLPLATQSPCCGS